VAVTAVIALVLAGGLVYALTGGSGHRGHSAGGQAQLAGAGGPVGPLTVTSVTPADKSVKVDGGGTVKVTFSEPLASSSPRPRLRPAVPGTWSQAGSALVFTPTSAFSPQAKIKVIVPGGHAGVAGADGATLAQPVTTSFHTAAWQPKRLAQLLAQLGYLPMTWKPSHHGAPVPSAASGSWLGSQMAAAYQPPAGKFRRAHGYPAELASFWQPRTYNVMLRGAVMAFQSQHHLKIDGTLTRALWLAVFRAAAADDTNLDGYTYALASKGSPETLTIWHNGHVVLHTAANTGIPQAPTADGTFPVYLRYPFQIMRGTNPDGSSYADPVSFVSYFNGGDAVHYFPRGSYGFQQSLGCVELPYDAAEQSYPYLTYGSLVTVTG
jgi:hypothetical protein